MLIVKNSASLILIIYTIIQEGSTALHLACAAGHASVALLLLSDGADIEIADAGACMNPYTIDEETVSKHLYIVGNHMRLIFTCASYVVGQACVSGGLHTAAESYTEVPVECSQSVAISRGCTGPAL